MDETTGLLAALNASFPDIAALDPLAARAAVDARIRPAENSAEADHGDFLIDAPSGQLRVRVYLPPARAGRGPRTVTLFAHGGGFLHGSIESHDGVCRRWAQRLGCTVVSVDYRLAPEAGAPAASEDMVVAAEWAVARGLGARVVLAGDSSGANAAAVAALMLRGRTDIRLAGQVLIYPFLDPTQASSSYALLGDSNFVRASTLAAYWRIYLAAPGSDRAAPWQINPALAADLTGLPPTILVTAGLDPLRAEGRAFGQALGAAGVPTVHRYYPGQFHGFLTIMGHAPALAAQEQLWSDIQHLILTTQDT